MDTSLGSWLERPLEIANFSWTTGGGFSEIFNPWTLFMEDPRNINKIAYFHNFKCKHLCLKFLINGGPFFYGRIMASYLPFDGDVNSYISDNMSFFAGLEPDVESTLITHSHRPHILLDPTLSQGGCFELPFLWYKNWLEIPTKEWQSLGKVSMQSFGNLSTAGGTTATTIKIKVFAWLVQPELSVPTTLLPTLPAQSTAGPADDDYGSPSWSKPTESFGKNDEYEGLVSKPASAVAAMAGKLTSFPVVGEYARATQIAAGGAASLAKLMGFSRPNVLQPLTPMRPTYVNDLAVTDKPEYVIKITTDSKQELSIAPDNFGIQTKDPFSIADLVGKETYLCSCVWGVGVVEGTNLFSSLVNPMLYGTYTPVGYTLNKQMVSTAMSYGAFPFRWWKGNIKFRFQLVASQYHRGRVKIVYDIATAPIPSKSNAVYSRIIDVQETTEFSVVVGWQNPQPMCQVQNTVVAFYQNWSTNSIPFTPDLRFDNGSISLFVENELMVPIPGVSADAQWLVWVSMENPVFNEPSTALQQVTPSAPFVATAGYEDEGPVTDTLQFGESGVDGNLNQVVFGETITSFRPLLRRYNTYTFMSTPGLSASIYSYISAVFRHFPLFPGSDANGINTTTTAVKTNFVSMTLVNYLAMAHSAYRGGIRYKFQNIASRQQAMEFLRYPDSGTSTYLTATTLGTANNSQNYASTAAKLGNAWLGSAVGDGSLNTFLEVEAPYWTPYRFDNPKRYSSNLKSASATQLVMNPVTGNAAVGFKVWLAAAEDFQLGMYTGPPNLWLSSYNTFS